jgi:hypothetical protein
MHIPSLSTRGSCSRFRSRWQIVKIQIETFMSQIQFDELEVWTKRLRLRLAGRGSFQFRELAVEVKV